LCFDTAIKKAAGNLSLKPTDQIGIDFNANGNLFSGLFFKTGGNRLLLNIIQING